MLISRELQNIELPAIAMLVFVTTISCSDELPKDPNTLGCQAQAVVYGIDDRKELRLAPEPWRTLAATTTIALISSETYEALERNPSSISHYTAKQQLELCEGEPFLEQPSIADCTGVLLAPDLVLTAAHCLTERSECSEYRYVRGFAMPEQGTFSGLDVSEVYSCRTALARQIGKQQDGAYADAALIQLDRPVHNLVTRTALRTSKAQPNEELVLMGHPAGLPLKVSGGGRVVDSRAPQSDYFGAELDSFEGGSGGAVFDMSGALLGAVVAGQEDFVFDETEQCYRTRRAESDPNRTLYEQVVYVANALRNMCAEGTELACELLQTQPTDHADPCR